MDKKLKSVLDQRMIALGVLHSLIASKSPLLEDKENDHLRRHLKDLAEIVMKLYPEQRQEVSDFLKENALKEYEIEGCEVDDFFEDEDFRYDLWKDCCSFFDKCCEGNIENQGGKKEPSYTQSSSSNVASEPSFNQSSSSNVASEPSFNQSSSSNVASDNKKDLSYYVGIWNKLGKWTKIVIFFCVVGIISAIGDLFKPNRAVEEKEKTVVLEQMINNKSYDAALRHIKNLDWMDIDNKPDILMSALIQDEEIDMAIDLLIWSSTCSHGEPIKNAKGLKQQLLFYLKSKGLSDKEKLVEDIKVEREK